MSVIDGRNGLKWVIPNVDYSVKVQGLPEVEDYTTEPLCVQQNNCYTGSQIKLAASYGEGRIAHQNVLWEITRGKEYAEIDRKTGELTIKPNCINQLISVKCYNSDDYSVFDEQQMTLTYKDPEGFNDDDNSGIGNVWDGTTTPDFEAHKKTITFSGVQDLYMATKYESPVYKIKAIVEPEDDEFMWYPYTWDIKRGNNYIEIIEGDKEEVSFRLKETSDIKEHDVQLVFIYNKGSIYAQTKTLDIKTRFMTYEIFVDYEIEYYGINGMLSFGTDYEEADLVIEVVSGGELLSGYSLSDGNIWNFGIADDAAGEVSVRIYDRNFPMLSRVISFNVYYQVDQSESYFTVQCLEDNSQIVINQQQFRLYQGYRLITIDQKHEIYYSVDYGYTWKKFLFYKNYSNNEAYLYTEVFNKGSRILIKTKDIEIPSSVSLNYFNRVYDINKSYYTYNIEPSMYPSDIPNILYGIFMLNVCKNGVYEGAKYSISGNIMSLVYGDDFKGKTELKQQAVFGHMFRNTYLQYAHNLYMPCLDVPDYGYNFMFYYTILKTAPKLPAKKIGIMSYMGMFYNTQIQIMPQLNFEEIGGHGCLGMFSNCHDIKKTVSLPNANNNYAYSQMFANCYGYTYDGLYPEREEENGYKLYYEGLIDASNLLTNIEKLYNGCFHWMFLYSNSLKHIPKLPWTELAEECYNSMFYNCYKIEDDIVLPAVNLKEYCYDSMFSITHENIKHKTKKIKINFTEFGIYNVAPEGEKPNIHTDIDMMFGFETFGNRNGKNQTSGVIEVPKEMTDEWVEKLRYYSWLPDTWEIKKV